MLKKILLTISAILIFFVLNSCKVKDNNANNQVSFNSKKLLISLEDIKILNNGCLLNLTLQNVSNEEIFIFPLEHAFGSQSVYFLVKKKDGSTIIFGNSRISYRIPLKTNVIKIKPNEVISKKCFLTTRTIAKDELKMNVFNNNYLESLGLIYLGNDIREIDQIKAIYEYDYSAKAFNSNNYGKVNMLFEKYESACFK